MVFHSATAAPAAANTANRALMHDVNVAGTEHVIAACLAARVPVLVYTSSASVVFDGTDLVDTDESAPYAARPIDFYTETKVPACVSAAVSEGDNAMLSGQGGPLLCARQQQAFLGVPEVDARFVTFGECLPQDSE